jgi:hypothetical protein
VNSEPRRFNVHRCKRNGQFPRCAVRYPALFFVLQEQAGGQPTCALPVMLIFNTELPYQLC